VATLWSLTVIKRTRGTWPDDGPATCALRKVPTPGPMRRSALSVRLEVGTLTGRLVRLEPLSVSHAAELAAAAEENRTAYEWTFVPRAEQVEEYIAAHLPRADEGRMIPFAQIRLTDGCAVGCTAYWDPRPWPGRAELSAIMIGWTWLTGSAQRSGINLEAKLLLFTYAFETLQVVRVDLSTDARNHRSRQAISGLGATFEGVLRQWSESYAPGEEGMLRDSALFSVLPYEWLTVKAGMIRRLRREAERSRGRPPTDTDGRTEQHPATNATLP
jgi:N-acetyltransferase